MLYTSRAVRRVKVVVFRRNAQRNATPAHVESGALRFIHYNYSPFGEILILVIGAIRDCR